MRKFTYACDLCGKESNDRSKDGFYEFDVFFEDNKDPAHRTMDACGFDCLVRLLTNRKDTSMGFEIKKITDA